MANFAGHQLTDAGRDLLASLAAASKAPVFTSVKVGSGELGGASIAGLTALIDPKESLAIASTPKRTQTGRWNVTAVLDNAEISADFYFREWGIFLQDLAGTGEVMLMYANAGNNGELIPKMLTDGTTSRILQDLTCACEVGAATTVGVMLSESLYTLYSDFEAHAGASNPHSGSEGLLKDAAAKDTPADADSVALVDSADSSKTKRVLWSRIKAVLGDVFAAKSHGTHVTYSTAAPAMDGTADAGSAETVSRSDHVHPTDTSRLAASQKGAASGLATLDANSKVTAAQASARAIYATNSLTFALDHAGCFIRFNSTGAVTCTVPNNSSVAFALGTEIEICRWGTGTVTIAAESNVTLASVDNARKIDAQYGVVCLKMVSTDIWLLSGCLGT